jgi:hypothetical protein
VSPFAPRKGGHPFAARKAIFQPNPYKSLLRPPPLKPSEFAPKWKGSRSAFKTMTEENGSIMPPKNGKMTSFGQQRRMFWDYCERLFETVF